MTPLIAELHNAHKERLARFARNAKPEREEISEPEPKAPQPENTECPTDKWIRRQKEIHKRCWFSIISDKPVEGRPSRAPLVRDIQRATCAVYGVKLADLLSERRTADIVRPRQVSVYLAKELTRLSLPKIGRSTGGRDHSTAFSSIKKIERLIASDADLRDRVNEIKAALGVAHA